MFWGEGDVRVGGVGMEPVIILPCRECPFDAEQRREGRMKRGKSEGVVVVVVVWSVSAGATLI
jgi:hypothetical protein